MQRRYIKPTESLQDRLASFAKNLRKKASLLPPGKEKDDLLYRARKADTVFHLDDLGQLAGRAATEVSK